MILKKKTLKKNLSNIENQFHILLNNNLLFNYLLFKGSKSGKPNKTFLQAWPIRVKVIVKATVKPCKNPCLGVGSLGLGFLLVFTGTLRTGVRDQDSHSLSFESKQPEVPVFSRKRKGFTGTFVFYETGTVLTQTSWFY